MTNSIGCRNKKNKKFIFPCDVVASFVFCVLKTVDAQGLRLLSIRQFSSAPAVFSSRMHIPQKKQFNTSLVRTGGYDYEI